MAAATILGVGVLAAVGVYGAGARGRQEARFRDLARRLLERRLESLDARGAGRLPACAGPPGCRAPGGDARPEKPAAGAYPCSQLLRTPSLAARHRDEPGGVLRLDTTVRAHPDPDQRGAGRLVTVGVCWHDLRGRLKQVMGRRLVLEGAGE
jgi:hypothetical protein